MRVMPGMLMLTILCTYNEWPKSSCQCSSYPCSGCQCSGYPRARSWLYLGVCAARMFCLMMVSVAIAYASDYGEDGLKVSVNGQVITDIVVAGNDKTKPVTILREVGLQVGDIPNHEQASAAAQAVLDLELFESVAIQMQGSRLIIRVEEKWYILPIPRLSANVEGDSSYGLSVKWYNFRGLNDTLDFAVFKSTHADKALDDSLTYRIRYDAPFVMNTDTNLNVGLRHEEDALSDDDFGQYNAKTNQLDIGISRWLVRMGPQQGWLHGIGLHWQDIQHDRPVPEVDEGQVTSLSASIEYRNRAFRLYSEAGTQASYTIETDLGFFNNDYHFTRHRLQWDWRTPGPHKHHTLRLGAQLGIATGGRQGTQGYSIGGQRTSRGHTSGDLDGDVFYALRVEYYAPVFNKSYLRAFVFMDIADIYADLDDLGHSNPVVSAGFGLRWRITEIVDLEVELGLGIPFGGDGDIKAFGGRV